MSSPPTKRRKSGHAPTTNDIDASNATTRFLLGNTQRAWMNTTLPRVPATPAADNRQSNSAVLVNSPARASSSAASVPSSVIGRSVAASPSTQLRAPVVLSPEAAVTSSIHGAPPLAISSSSENSVSLASLGPQSRHEALAFSAMQPAVSFATSAYPAHHTRPNEEGSRSCGSNYQGQASLADGARPPHQTPLLQSVSRPRNSPQLGQSQASLPSPAPSEDQVTRSPCQSTVTASISCMQDRLNSTSGQGIPHSQTTTNIARLFQFTPQHMHSDTHLPRAQVPSQVQDPWSIFNPSVCLPKIHAFTARAKLTPFDRHRLELVAEASRMSDCFYMIVSQFMGCFRAKDVRLLPMSNPPLDRAGLKIIEQFTGGLWYLSPHVVSFLQHFPMPLSEVCQGFGTSHYQQIFNDIAMCTTKLRLNWEPMLKHYVELRSLPLAQDLLHSFAMSSVCLQRMAFRTMLRLAWGTDQGGFAEQAWNHFIDEQHYFLSRKVVDDANAHYLVYRELYSKHVASQQTTNTTHGSVVQSPATSWITPRQSIATQIQSNSPAHPAALKNAQLLIPPRNVEVRQFAHADYRRLALHQAHLRDPMLKYCEPVGSPAKRPVFFRYVSGFALSPQQLVLRPIQEFKFSLTAEQIARVPAYLDGQMGAPPTAIFESSSLQFRLKCCQSAKGVESAWTSKEPTWPNWLYVSINGEPLELRRKLQHGKCLPADVSRKLQLTDTLKVVCNLASDADIPSDHFVAIEVVRFATGETLKLECLAERVQPAEDVRASIKSSLAKDQNHDDDDIAIIQSNIVIDLFEPFSNARIFDIPVRGVDCAHREAIDLDVFLETRSCEGEETKISNVDDWRCPICRADARPQSLIVDGFLQEVRKILAESRSLKTRTIIVESDGRFRAKPGSNDAESSDEEEDAAADGRLTTTNRMADVIELDSD